jgi:Uma2 family endonuclease
MTMIVCDPWNERRLREEREASGADRFDEVWDGVYVMSPLANEEHQRLVGRLVFVLQSVLGLDGPHLVYPGINLSDRAEGWEHNYRGPDVAVFLAGTAARNLGTHWMGAADFLAEIISPFDRTREKLPFYEQLGVREVLLVDRDPWALELYRHQAGALVLAGRSTLTQPDWLASAVLPLQFRLAAGPQRPVAEAVHSDGAQRWSI